MFKNKSGDRSRKNYPVAARSLAPMRAKSDGDSASPLSAVIKGVLWGLVAVAISGIILISIASAIASATADSTAYIAPLALAALMPSMLLGGLVAEKRSGGSPILCGILTGGAVTLISIAAAIILRALPSSHYRLWQSITLHLAAIAFSVLGALLGSIKFTPKRPKRRFGR